MKLITQEVIYEDTSYGWIGFLGRNLSKRFAVEELDVFSLVQNLSVKQIKIYKYLFVNQIINKPKEN